VGLIPRGCGAQSLRHRLPSGAGFAGKQERHGREALQVPAPLSSRQLGLADSPRPPYYTSSLTSPVPPAALTLAPCVSKVTTEAWERRPSSRNGRTAQEYFRSQSRARRGSEKSAALTCRWTTEPSPARIRP